MYMRTKEEIKGVMKLMQLLLFLYIYVHLTACVFWLIVSRREVWIPPTDSINGETEIYHNNLPKKYWYSFYHAVWLLVGVETNPLSDDNLQIFYTTATIICGALFKAYLFGEMAVLMIDLRAKSTRFAEIVDGANTVMKTLRLPMII
jgi:hypothetical protein